MNKTLERLKSLVEMSRQFNKKGNYSKNCSYWSAFEAELVRAEDYLECIFNNGCDCGECDSCMAALEAVYGVDNFTELHRQLQEAKDSLKEERDADIRI